jgi:hypothetical protein
MSGLRLDISELGWICPILGPDMSGQQKFRAAEKWIGSQDDASWSR